ncbi:MAG: hypothetical protein EHM58_10090 [Ignavibacteriae bacterium]|nr:MAG: hypothetical protein EHM58_10090 [Ignavibacteriota bacterium]
MSLFKVTALREKFPPLIFHIIYFLFAVTFCFLFYLKVVKAADFGSQTGINAVLSFDTVRPFQYRLLVPFLIKLFSPLHFIPFKALFMVYSVAVVYLIILAYYYILTEYFENNLINALLAPFIIYPMIWNYILVNDTFQYYDFTAILLFTMGLYFILKDNFKALLIIFIIGLINKETIVYLIFAYLLFNYKSVFTKKIILNTVILGVLFIAVKIALYFLFLANPGAPVEWGYLKNIQTISTIWKNQIAAKDILFSFGGLYIFAILLFITGKWKNFYGAELKGKLMINLVIIPFIIVAAFTSYFEEVRVYTELIPLFTTLFLIYLSSAKKVPIHYIGRHGTG